MDWFKLSYEERESGLTHQKPIKIFKDLLVLKKDTACKSKETKDMLRSGLTPCKGYVVKVWIKRNRNVKTMFRDLTNC